jgi:hypothetical protein
MVGIITNYSFYNIEGLEEFREWHIDLEITGQPNSNRGKDGRTA